MIQQIVQYLVDSLTFGSVTALSALGITLVFGVMRMMNFAHGELVIVGSYLLMVLGGIPLIPAIIATLLCVWAWR